jgi:type IV secretory pathway component VirB8
MNFSFKRFASKSNDDVITPDDNSIGDKFGSYIADKATPLAEHRTHRTTNRLLLAIVGVSLAINCVQSVTIMTLWPLYRVVPFFVTFSDKSDQVVTINPPKSNLSGLGVLVEKQVYEYTVSRHTISEDPEETIGRWGGRVRSLSSPEVYQAFLNETKPIYDDLKERRFTRSISIKSVIQPSPGFYRVEFEAIDRRVGTGLTDGGETRTTFINEMRVTTQPRAVRYEDRFLNPIGFTVVSYAVRPKE